jgi:hypothetical protein
MLELAFYDVKRQAVRVGPCGYGDPNVGLHRPATSSVGLLVRERNYLVHMVLSGAHGALRLTDLLPLAQRQVAIIATAR